MTGQFHSPYQFIPVDTSRTPVLKWEQRGDLERGENRFTRHDYWDREGWSGRITCTLTCCSPLVVGGNQLPGSDTRPGCVEPYTHPDGRLAVPGNSLRGMVASVVETISQSALRVLSGQEETCYSQRKLPEHALKKIGVLLKEGERYSLYPLTERCARVSVRNHFVSREQCYQHRDNPRIVYARMEGTDAKGLRERPGGERVPGILHIRARDAASAAKMPNKHYERFIPWDGEIQDDRKRVSVDVELIRQLETMLRERYERDKDSGQLPKGYRRAWGKADAELVRPGDLLYYACSGGRATELAYSAVWRKPVDGDLYEALIGSGGDNAVPWGPGRGDLTPAERLFGVVEDRPETHRPARNLASRVRFTDAVPLGEVEPEAPIVLKVLASPKPPSPAMYFSAANGGYIAKQDLDLSRHAPNGRKHYVAQRRRDASWETQFREGKDDDNKDAKWKLRLRVAPIPQGTQFRFEIHFENLERAELGLLRTALQPGEGFVHRLGLGKPLGLGQVTLEVESIERIRRLDRYTPEGLRRPRYAPCGDEIDTAMVDAEALALLNTVSNPDYLTDAPVRYPFTNEQGPEAETDGFKWFVANDKGRGGHQYLQPMQAYRKLPVLDCNDG